MKIENFLRLAFLILLFQSTKQQTTQANNQQIQQPVQATPLPAEQTQSTQNTTQGQSTQPQANQQTPIQVPTQQPIQQPTPQQQQQTQSTPVIPEQPKQPEEECNQMLVQSYSLQGLKNPSSDVMLNMCPTIRKSCCTQKDQLEIYGQYVASKKIENIRDWTEQMKNLHMTVLDVFNATEKYAKDILQRQKDKKIGNCKLLAERIVSFDTSRQINLIKKVFQKMQDFLIESWQGFYCSICNYDYHQYFKTTHTKVQVSSGFCRGMVENVLQSQLYVHVHFNKLANLTSKFMTSCNFKGDYEVGLDIPKQVAFPVNDSYKESIDHLLQCKRFRNEKDWVVYCKKLCSKFNIAKVDLFLAGDSVKITNFIDYVKLRAKAWENEKKSQPVLEIDSEGGDDDSQQVRILSLQEKKKKVKKMFLSKRRLNFVKKDPILYPTKLGGIVNLSLYIHETQDFGVDFQATGSASVITQEMFKVVKQSIQLEEQKKMAEEQEKNPKQFNLKII